MRQGNEKCKLSLWQNEFCVSLKQLITLVINLARMEIEFLHWSQCFIFCTLYLEMKSLEVRPIITAHNRLPLFRPSWFSSKGEFGNLSSKNISEITKYKMLDVISSNKVFSCLTKKEYSVTYIPLKYDICCCYFNVTITSLPESYFFPQS